MWILIYKKLLKIYYDLYLKSKLEKLLWIIINNCIIWNKGHLFNSAKDQFFTLKFSTLSPYNPLLFIFYIKSLLFILGGSIYLKIIIFYICWF